MKDRRLVDYRKKIDFLKKLISEIIVMPKNVPMNLFLIDCSKLNQVRMFTYCAIIILLSFLFVIILSG